MSAIQQCANVGLYNHGLGIKKLMAGYFSRPFFLICLLVLGLCSSVVHSEEISATTGVDAQNIGVSKTPSQADIKLAYINPRPIPNDLPRNSIVWPLLPLESVTQLSALFYPNNKPMQARFISTTLDLNQQSFKANSVSQQVVLILIPDIKALSASGNDANFKRLYKQPKNLRQDRPWLNPLQLSYQLKDAAEFYVSAKLVAAYDDLIKRNNYLKQELNKLNLKLAGLQKLMEALKVQALQLFSSPNVANPAPIQLAQTPINDSANTQSKADDITPTKQLKQLVPLPSTSLPQDSVQQEPLVQDQNVVVYILLGLLAFAVLAGLFIYRRSALKSGSHQVEDLFNPLAIGAFKGVKDLGKQEAQELQSLDFSLTATESANIGLDTEPFTFKEQSESILEQARIYVSFDRADEAISLLKAQIKTMPKASLHHWLYLLDIYRDNQLEEDFLRDAKELHATFNVLIPEWQTAAVSPTVNSALEDYPHIIARLSEIWHSDAVASIAYLEELLTDNRDQERIGFGLPVFLEILCLVNILTVREKMALDR